MELEFTLLRILKGRLTYRRGDLSLFIVEPNQDLMFKSIDIYDKAYEKAYGEGLYLKQDVEELLMTHNLWSPFEDQELEKLKKDNEELKYQCFKNYHKKRELSSLKMAIDINEKKYNKIAARKYQFDQLTCEGVASQIRWNWLIENSTFYQDESPYDWKHARLETLVKFYENSFITASDFRSIARLDQWRSMWNLGKKTGSLFDKPSYLLSRDQLTLCSYSTMYDNVYESPDCPDDKVIEDDYCLDGWFIDQKRKGEKYKKEKQSESVLTNSKIANSPEIFMVASDVSEIDTINSMNSHHSEMIKKERMQTIKNKGVVESDAHFSDVQEGLFMKSNESFIQHMRGK
jgi:hypothetical protein